MLGPSSAASANEQRTSAKERAGARPRLECMSISFGSWAVSRGDPWLCDLASRRECLCREHAGKLSPPPPWLDFYELLRLLSRRSLRDFSLAASVARRFPGPAAGSRPGP